MILLLMEDESINVIDKINMPNFDGIITQSKQKFTQVQRM